MQGDRAGRSCGDCHSDKALPCCIKSLGWCSEVTDDRRALSMTDRPFGLQFAIFSSRGKLLVFTTLSHMCTQYDRHRLRV
jgi:hypothetical protein